ncbi:uncharacterized protein LOC135950391 [Calliphora vicina]|uniref:uncharacterized protein LOC135950391 n=1 Tax=Calliphora vicina TaxID=7373 RepID=UPI00325A5A11
MYLKHLIIIVSTIMCVSSSMLDLEIKYKTPATIQRIYDSVLGKQNTRSTSIKMANFQSQPENSLQEKLSEMQTNYSNLLDELNTVKLSQKSLMENHIDLEKKYFELIRNKEDNSKSKNYLNLRMDNFTSQLMEKYNDLDEKYLELMKNKETDSKLKNDLNSHMDNIATE